MPRGWTNFLNTLAELNIPLSSVNNPHRGGCLQGKAKIILSLRWSRLEEGEEVEEEEEEEETPETLRLK